MAGKPNMRLSGWVKDSNLFDNDLRFVGLIEHKGALAYLIYDIMRGLISSTYGYYSILDDNFILRIHRTLGRCSKGQAHIKGVIEYFGEIGILDKCSLDNNILTSADIQQAWLVAKKAKRTRITGDLDYWLLVDTFPVDNDNFCSKDSNHCSKDSEECYKDNNHCNIDHTEQDCLFNNEQEENLSGKVDDNWYADTILETVFSKETDPKEVMKAFKIHKHYEEYYQYTKYLAHACLDTRINKYGAGIDSIEVDNEFFLDFVGTVRKDKLFDIYAEVYNRHSDIKENIEYYLRGVVVNKHKQNWKIKHNKKNGKRGY